MCATAERICWVASSARITGERSETPVSVPQQTTLWIKCTLFCKITQCDKANSLPKRAERRQLMKFPRTLSSLLALVLFIKKWLESMTSYL